MEKQKNKGGRPPRSPGEKLDQFSIRLTPKMRFGLDLLARAQGRSLSQVVEWALQVGLNAYKVNSSSATVADVLDAAWPKEHEVDRAITIYRAAPSLLQFEDVAACQLVEECTEAKIASDLSPLYFRAETGTPEADRFVEHVNFMHTHTRAAYLAFVRAYWPQIKGAAAEKVAVGKPLSGTSILQAIGLKSVGSNIVACLRLYTELAPFETLTLRPAHFERLMELDAEEAEMMNTFRDLQSTGSSGAQPGSN